jgi:hypothetical protein
LLNEQLDAYLRDSAYLSSRSSDHYGACDSDSCSSDGDGDQEDTDSGAGSSGKAVAALRADAEHPAGADAERAQADAAKVTKHQAAAAANATRQCDAAAAAKKLKAETAAKHYNGMVAIQEVCLQAGREYCGTASSDEPAPHPGYDEDPYYGQLCGTEHQDLNGLRGSVNSHSPIDGCLEVQLDTGNYLLALSGNYLSTADNQRFCYG